MSALLLRNAASASIDSLTDARRIALGIVDLIVEEADAIPFPLAEDVQELPSRRGRRHPPSRLFSRCGGAALSGVRRERPSDK
jgi:hypothetical protein